VTEIEGMRIAQIAPLALPVPPGRYGGTERVVHDLTEGLVRRGHDVTLFASGDSRTSARLRAIVPHALWQVSDTEPGAAEFLLHAIAMREAGGFDIVHSHTGHLAFPFAAGMRAPLVATLHGRLDSPHLADILCVFAKVHLVSISQAQRLAAPDAHWSANIPHGLSPPDYPFDAEGGRALCFIGRMSPQKCPHVAIDVALAAGLPIALAGRIDPSDRAYFEREVRPRLDHPLVDFRGEVGHDEKLRLFARSRALLFPIDWPEPFGLVMIEAMACGTPVVARPRGSVAEVVLDGVTGLLGEDERSFVEAVKAVHRLDRHACRRHVELHFSLSRMIDDYERLYRTVV
jgi:glycosyltransferase involved in cell wall biosynthesis